MEESWQSSEISLEILIHTSARVTTVDDEKYRKQGGALLNYLSERTRDPIETDKSRHYNNLACQTPAASEVLVPATSAKAVRPTVLADEPTFAIAESILVPARVQESSSSGPIAASIPMIQTRASQAQQFQSQTSSTASLPTIHASVTETKKGKQVASHGKKDKRQTIWQDHQAVTQTISQSHPVVSPDSARFVFESPDHFRNRKRELEKPNEEPRKAEESTVLAERSPNKRRKINDGRLRSKEVDITSTSADPTPPLNPTGWLSSIAQLTSSTNDQTSSKLPVPSISSEFTDDGCFMPLWPVTGEQEFSTHVVGSLAVIAQNPRICAAYKPRNVLRPIEVLERGYWHLKVPASWTQQDQEDFWTLLEDMITEGRCGWGIWLEHISGKAPNDHATNKPVAKSSSDQRYITEIRLWCWGEVVRECWLAMLMASRRQTMRLGMKWYDSMGEMVIQMR